MLLSCDSSKSAAAVRHRQRAPQSEADREGPRDGGEGQEAGLPVDRPGGTASSRQYESNFTLFKYVIVKLLSVTVVEFLHACFRGDNSS